MPSLCTPLITLVLVGIGGCETRDLPAATLGALDGAEAYEVLSLDPSSRDDATPGDFHGWRVLGRQAIRDAGTRKRLTDALRAGTRGSDGSRATCFQPRHGVHVTRAGKVTDLVICFECRQIRVFVDGTKTADIPTTTASEAECDRTLRDAGVRLADKPT